MLVACPLVVVLVVVVVIVVGIAVFLESTGDSTDTAVLLAVIGISCVRV